MERKRSAISEMVEVCRMGRAQVTSAVTACGDARERAMEAVQESTLVGPADVFVEKNHTSEGDETVQRALDILELLRKRSSENQAALLARMGESADSIDAQVVTAEKLQADFLVTTPKILSLEQDAAVQRNKAAIKKQQENTRKGRNSNYAASRNAHDPKRKKEGILTDYAIRDGSKYRW